MVDPRETQLSPESVNPRLCTIQYDYENTFVQLDARNSMSVVRIIYCMSLVVDSLMTAYAFRDTIMLKNYRNNTVRSEIPTTQGHESYSKYVGSKSSVSASNTDQQVIVVQKYHSILILAASWETSCNIPTKYTWEMTLCSVIGSSSYIHPASPPNHLSG